MNLKIANDIIIRTPQFPLNAKMEDYWSSLKQSIELASPEFYQEIKDKDFKEWDSLKDRQRQTLWRYFNRSVYRPVPFGTFASVGLIKQSGNRETIRITSGQQCSHFYDWPLSKSFDYSFSDVLSANMEIIANSSWYQIGDRIRFIYSDNGSFELSDIRCNSDMLAVLACCIHNIKINTAIASLTDENRNKEDALTLIEKMILAGLIFTGFDANITGKDYFKRIGFDPTSEKALYTVAARKATGSIGVGLFRHVKDAITMMDDLEDQDSVTDDLKSFKERFTAKFAVQEIPLLQALDPELGVGYGNLELSGATSDLLTKLIRKEKKKSETAVLKSKFMQLLAFGMADNTIRLEELGIQKSDGAFRQKPANSVSCIFSICDDLLVVDRIGGYSINQLAGRFTLAHDGILQFCKEQAALEASANPGVIFFDIAYLAESKVDNVNRREHIYDNEAAISAFSTANNQVLLNDLTVKVSGSDIVLFSSSLNRRVVPRMASAYNYQRTDLPVFKLLCDLMYHDIRSEYSIDSFSFLSQISRRPRIQYKNIVLARASWILKLEDLAGLRETDQLREVLIAMGLCRYFRSGSSDQLLTYDLERAEDLKYLLAELIKLKSIVLEEALLANSSIVRDENGDAYAAQFITALNHSEQIYYKSGAIQQSPKAVQPNFAPGSEWLSSEIYCHPLSADGILVKELTSVLHQYEHTIKKWFFIRYNENGNHIRFRLLVKNKSCAAMILLGLNAALENAMFIGTVADLQFKTYRREIERYGFAGMEHVESLFCQDAGYVIELLECQLADEQKYTLCLALMDSICEDELIDEKAFAEWLQKVCNGYNKEHAIDATGFKHINNYGKEKGLYGPAVLNINAPARLHALVGQYASIIKRCTGVRQMPLFTDLLHMHINRLFAEYQRLHETIIYNTWLSRFKQKKALAGSKAVKIL